MGRGTSGVGVGVTQPRSAARQPVSRGDRFLAGSSVLNAGPIPYRNLPMAGDYDLERNLDGAYGAAPDTFTFGLARCDSRLWFANLPREEKQLVVAIREIGARFYEQMENEWRDKYCDDDGPLQEGEAPREIGPDYPDGYRRAQIVRGNVAALKSGRQLDPIVCDVHGYDGGIDIMDGYHRLAAHIIAGTPQIEFYYLL
jgi:hypothetical protein